MSGGPSSLDASFVVVDSSTVSSQTSPATSSTSTQPSDRTHPSLSNSYKPGSGSSYAHDWSHKATGGPIKVQGRHFIDAYGRVCGLRGVNLSGCCKTPANHDHSTFPANAQSVTFVGRPFPLEEAPVHFARLRRWGLTFIRFLVTWEAVEHAGPGIYDTEYLQYLRQLLALLPEYGLVAFISVHQDVWSRYSGGSGAPAWTLELVGFDLNELETTGAAWLRGITGGGHVVEEQGLWPCGYHKLAAATMATCFWGGDVFTPMLSIEDAQGIQQPVQQFLQGAFLDMFEVLAKTVGDLEGVIGLQMLNEMHPGYINLPSLHEFNYNTDLHLSYIPTAFESFRLGAGHPTSVSCWTRSFPMPTRKTGSAVLNPDGHKVWRRDGPSGGKCIWELHNVWGWDKMKDAPVVLRENYFTKHPKTGDKVDFYTDFYYPFIKKWSDRMRRVIPEEKLSFVELVPNEFCPATFTPEHHLPNMVFAPHWYDLKGLFMKSFGNFSVNVQGLSRGMFLLNAFYWGQKGARKNFSLQIRNIVEAGYRILGETPVIIGETGLPMDMNNREAFETEDYTWQARMMDAITTGLERALIGFTLWNYNPENNDQEGDNWNGENFSWFSQGRALPRDLLSLEQDSATLDNGGRILRAVVRPYAAKTAGIPVRFRYEMNSGEFEYEWSIPSDKPLENPIQQDLASVEQPPIFGGHPALTSRETEIFIPSMLTEGRRVLVRGLGEGDKWEYDKKRQTLFILTHDVNPEKNYRVRVSFDPPLEPMFEVNDFWTDFGGHLVSVAIVLLALTSYYLKHLWQG